MILVDTTPLVALCDPRDQHHERALHDVDRIARRGLLVCAPVLTEACFLLESRVQRRRLVQILLGLGARALSFDDEVGTWTRVFAWLDKYAEHEPDWADGYIAVASGIVKSAKVWTYDAEFGTTWRREDGTKVPLAVR